MENHMQVSEPSAKYMVKVEEYQQPKAGIIPCEWTVKRLGEIITLQRGFDLPHRDRKTGDYPIVTSSGFEAFHNEYRAKAPGVVTGRYGTIGQVFLVATDYWPLNTTLYVRDFHGNDPNFISHLLRTVDFHSHSGKSGVPGVNRNDLHEIKTAYPADIAEQQAIATALSDTDALIDALEQLLAKKRQVKQGAVCNLLTGKVRLPGFFGAWKECRLDEIGSFTKGTGITKDQAQSGSLPCVRYGEIYTAHHDWIRKFNSRISESVARTACPLKAGDILFAGSGETKSEIGKAVAFLEQCEAYAGGDIVIFRPRNMNSMFLGYYLNTPAINQQKASLGQGDAVVHISSSALKTISCTIPDLDEQTAIAAILSDMDTDITELETRLGKVRQVKQGMMRELLTGRTRLV